MKEEARAERGGCRGEFHRSKCLDDSYHLDTTYLTLDHFIRPIQIHDYPLQSAIILLRQYEEHSETDFDRFWPHSTSNPGPNATAVFALRAMASTDITGVGLQKSQTAAPTGQVSDSKSQYKKSGSAGDVRTEYWSQGQMNETPPWRCKHTRHTLGSSHARHGSIPAMTLSSSTSQSLFPPAPPTIIVRLNSCMVASTCYVRKHQTCIPTTKARPENSEAAKDNT
jgi:hypothetical protein